MRLLGHFHPWDPIGQGLIQVTGQGQWERPHLSRPHIGTPPQSLRDKSPYRTIEKRGLFPLPAALGATCFPLIKTAACFLCVRGVHFSTAVNKNLDSGIIFLVSLHIETCTVSHSRWLLSRNPPAPPVAASPTPYSPDHPSYILAPGPS